MMPHGLDTSPVIEFVGKSLPNGNKEYVDNDDCLITILYNYPTSSVPQTMTAYGLTNNIHTYADGRYKDYWGWGAVSQPVTRNVINSNTNGIRCTIHKTRLNECYAFLVETGQILFAGKNSIYYGHKNISELE